MVTDKAFNVLYGENRSRNKQLFLSVRLFRPIKIIVMAEGAGPDLVTQGAISLSRRPFAVFFPYRYREAAWRYLTSRPDSPVVILAGRKTQGSDETSHNMQENEAIVPPLWVYTDSETDLYRAGVMAGVFVRYEKQNGENTDNWGDIVNQEIALFHEGHNNEEITAFIAGLEEQQWTDFPLYSPDLADINLSCAVILDNFRFNAEGKVNSLIFFSWMDPALAPRKTLAIFDDSPWTQIGPALGYIKQGRQNALVPSEVIFFREDKIQKDVYNEINKLKTLKKKVENADN
ncbi:MAG: hypothetical protein FWG07_06610 [Treponema sp.]|nr:hypothetical protein [Treponema sp.]